MATKKRTRSSSAGVKNVGGADSSEKISLTGVAAATSPLDRSRALYRHSAT